MSRRNLEGGLPPDKITMKCFALQMWNKSPADQFFSSVMKKNIFAVISSVSICLVFRSLITINNNHFSRVNSFILTLKLESVATYTWRYLLLITCPKQSSGVPLILTSSAFHILTSFFSLALFSDSLSYPRSLTPPPPLLSVPSSLIRSCARTFLPPLNAPLLVL